ncbi:SAC3/GANP/Nin1/mts3/eIF-3 p25 family-domain-containing protein [Biscogniauxia marginata]|nr:SAC3/GANP/Nin1/mts3/eIF-3 p25 family-domain-containing protein [Biscogniauxia marginata]
MLKRLSHSLIFIMTHYAIVYWNRQSTLHIRVTRSSRTSIELLTHPDTAPITGIFVIIGTEYRTQMTDPTKPPQSYSASASSSHPVNPVSGPPVKKFVKRVTQPQSPEASRAPESPPPENPIIINTSTSTSTSTGTLATTITITPPTPKTTESALLSQTQTRSQPQHQPPSSKPPTSPTTMAERTLQQILQQLKSNPQLPYPEASTLLSKAKLALLQLKAATPSASTPPAHLSLARDVYEAGALFTIRARNPDAFTRYVSQLQPFYELPPSSLGGSPAERNKVTGLYLLLLLTQGRYAEFHSELETLGTREGGVAGAGAAADLEGDRYLGYPIRLERWLMEGSYDRVWKAMKSREVPSEEYGVFSEILTSQIRSEIASSSERAYPSLPLSSTKSLLFLDSEGAVVDFARHRGWVIRDGHIYFPATISGTVAAVAEEDGVAEDKELSQMVIENTLGYARELETIV